MKAMKPPSIMKPPSVPKMAMVQPNYSQRAPIVNDAHFTDGPAQPTIGSPKASFNPGQGASALPNGPPRFINAPGKRVYGTKGLTNKRQTSDL